jgi:hypothetical protein
MDTEDWITDLQNGDRLSLRIGDCRPPFEVEAGFEEFSVEDVDQVDVIVKRIHGWNRKELGDGAYSLTVEFVNKNIVEEMDAIAEGGKLRWKSEITPFDLTLKIPATKSMAFISSASVEAIPELSHEM